MTRALLVILATALVAAALLRRRVPSYPTYQAYREADAEGDALEPDLYLVALLAAGQGK